MPSYLERTMAVLKSQDFMVAKTEHFNALAGVRQDLFGMFDLLALHPAYGTIGVQVCGPGDFGAHVTKLTGARKERLILWLAAAPSNRCILIGWRKLKKHTPDTLAGDRAGAAAR